jgi:hypothetical protein
MRPGSVALLALLLAPAVCAAAQEGGNVRVRAPIRGQFVESRRIGLSPGQTRIELGVSFLVEGSDSLVLDGVPLRRGEDYRINILKGTVILVDEPAGGETLEIRWSRYPFSFEPVFAARFPGERPATGVTVPLPPAGPAKPAHAGGQSNIRVSGNKTLGFSLGSGKDLGIDQNLKVTMMGSLAPDLEVRAYLSDDDLPVQPQGNTEELTHLDKVAVQVISRHTETNLGDFSTGEKEARFAAFERELRGASVKVDAFGQEAFAGGGITKGRYQTVSIFGTDGMQGPYELLPPRRFNGVIILPGTEAVYLDGRRMRRGAENEYTIDYMRGTVTFTERVTISRDSEIVVEFQSGEDGYKRSTITGGYTVPIAGASLSASYFREADDPDRPVRGTLGDEERAVLEGAGDDPSKAVASGIRPVEDAQDAYILVPAAGGVPEHFEFVETGGQYAVSFYEAGSGAGDYVTDGFTRRGEVKYRYAGEGEGNYRVGRPLALPQRHEVFTVKAKGSSGIFFADAEGNVSLLDRNILSGLDDGDDRGGAVGARAGFGGLLLGGGALSVQGDYSSLEERYAAPDRAREPYFYRNWNLDGVPLAGTERIWGATAEYTRDELWRIGGGWHRLDRGDLEADRGEGALRLGDPADRGIEVAGYDTRTGEIRDRRYGRAEAAFGVGRLLPRVVFDTERYRARDAAAPDTGRFYWQNVVSLSRRGAGALQGTVSYLARRTDLMSATGGQWSRDRENDEIRFDGGYTMGPRIVELVLSHRETRYRTTGANSTSDLARLRWRDAWWSGSVTNDLGYRLSSGVDRRVEKAVVYVGENQGDYDESGNEVGQNRGDYMVVYLPAEDALPVRAVELTWRLSAGSGVRALSAAQDEGGGGLWGRVRRNVSVDHFFTVTERSTTDELLRFYTLDPSILQRDDATLYGRYSLRQEWSLLGGVQRSDLHIVLSREDEEDNRTEGISIESLTQEASVRFETLPVESVTLTFEAAGGTSERDGGGVSGQSYRVKRLSGSHTTGWRPRPPYKVAVEVGAEDRRDELSGAEQTSLSASPSLDASLGTKMHVSAMLRMTWTDERSSAGKPLFFLEQGLREDWNVMGQYRFTKFISIGLNYNGRHEKDYTGEVRTVHAFKIESRAYF